MHSADPTIGRSVCKTPRGHERTNTFNWGMAWNFGMQTSLLPNQSHDAESGGTSARCRPYRPAVTATGEGRP